MIRSVAPLPRWLFLALMLAGSALITWTSLGYFDSEELPPFVIEKLQQSLRFEALWMAALRVHVAAAVVTFPVCLLLMTRPLQRRPVWHRWIGRLTGTLVLFALVPSGVVLAFEAKGGRAVSAGFLLSALIVGWGIVHGIVTARRRDLVSHQRAMRHVVAQMSVAVTSRTLMFVLDSRGVDPAVAYVVALWVPVLGSALVAELVSSRFIWNRARSLVVDRSVRAPRSRREVFP